MADPEPFSYLAADEEEAHDGPTLPEVTTHDACVVDGGSRCRSSGVRDARYGALNEVRRGACVVVPATCRGGFDVYVGGNFRSGSVSFDRSRFIDLWERPQRNGGRVGDAPRTWSQAVERYRAKLQQDPELVAELDDLVGKRIACCSCRDTLKQPCHAHALALIVNQHAALPPEKINIALGMADHIRLQYNEWSRQNPIVID
jgi:hypothetical protein